MIEIMYWITKDGRKINYSEMDDNHILNTIKHIEKNAKKLAWKLRLGELYKSMGFPDGSDALENAKGCFIESLATDDDLEIVKRYYEPYLKLKIEAEKRNILFDSEKNDIPDDDYCNYCGQSHNDDIPCGSTSY